MEGNKFIPGTDFSQMVQNKEFSEKAYHQAQRNHSRLIFSVGRRSNGSLDIYSEIEIPELKKTLIRIITEIENHKPIQLLKP